MANLTIIIPGFLSSSTNELYREAINYFNEQNQELIVFSYKRNSFSLLQEVNSLHNLIRSKKDSNLHLIGHSLGAYLALCLAGEDSVKNITLWDPSLHPREIFRNYLLSVPSGLSSPSVDEQAEAETLPEITDLLTTVKKPVLVIYAEKGGYPFTHNLYTEKKNLNVTSFVIKGADHNFEGETRKKLFLETR